MTKIELGAGATRKPGWLAIDLNPELGDIVADAAGPLPFADCEVDEIRAVDVLEHISYRDTDRALAEWARVCAPGAALYVQVPDVDTLVGWFVNRDPRLEVWDRGACSSIDGLQWRLLGGHADGRYVGDGSDFRFNAHYSLWSADSLTDALTRAGFVVDSCVTNAHPNLCVHAHRS